MSLKMAHKVIVPQKKIMSRSFLNSGTLIVIMRVNPFRGPLEGVEQRNRAGKAGQVMHSAHSNTVQRPYYGL
jgi:hypothetical protein